MASKSPVREVAPGIHRFSNGVSNFYLVEASGSLLLVDAGAAADWKLFTEGLSILHRQAADLKTILLTHAHSDHTGFAEQARSEAHALVWVHVEDSGIARGGASPKNEGKLLGYLIHAQAWKTLFGLARNKGLKVVPILMVSTFTDRQRIEAPGNPTVVHLPGHTAGMSAIYLESKGVLFTGDALVTKNPLTGRRGPQIMPSGLNQNSDRALRSLEGLSQLPVNTLLPGHGEPWTDGVERAVQLAQSAGRS